MLTTPVCHVKHVLCHNIKTKLLLNMFKAFICLRWSPKLLTVQFFQPMCFANRYITSFWLVSQNISNRREKPKEQDEHQLTYPQAKYSFEQFSTPQFLAHDMSLVIAGYLPNAIFFGILFDPSN